MHRSIRASAAALSVMLATAPAALAADGMASAKDEQGMLVVDAPDLYRITEKDIGPRFSSLKGKELYSNTGKRIGEIEDFVLGRDGNVYAVVDTSKGPIKDLLKFGDDEMMILPLRELRRAARDHFKKTDAPASKSSAR